MRQRERRQIRLGRRAGRRRLPTCRRNRSSTISTLPPDASTRRRIRLRRETSQIRASYGPVASRRCDAVHDERMRADERRMLHVSGYTCRANGVRLQVSLQVDTYGLTPIDVIRLLQISPAGIGNALVLRGSHEPFAAITGGFVRVFASILLGFGAHG